MNQQQLFDYATSILKQSEIDEHIDSGDCVEFLETFTESCKTGADSFVIVNGNPIDGLDFIGPFSDGELANEYVESDQDLRNNDWWVARLNVPA